MRNRGRVSFSTMIVIVTLLVPQLFFIPIKASPFTTVTITLQGEPPCVDVSPGSSGIVTVNGEVTCVKYGPDQVKVFLVANSTHGDASVTPASFVFGGASGTEETEPFSVSTQVPQGTSSSTPGTITVSGVWVQGGLQYEIAPVSIIIIIWQYYKMGVAIDETRLLVNSGDTANIEFDVHNEGNGDDIFLIDLENREGLESKGFKLPTPMEVPIGEDSCRNISYEVGIPKNISGIQTLNLCITSKGSESSNSTCKYRMTITLEVVNKKTEGLENGETHDEIVPDELFSLPVGLTIVIIAAALLVVLVLRKKRRAGVTSP